MEHRDATDEQRKIREINTGVYCAENPFLFEAASEIGNDNVQKEYYFTDIFAIARRKEFARLRSSRPTPAKSWASTHPRIWPGATEIVQERFEEKLKDGR